MLHAQFKSDEERVKALVDLASLVEGQGASHHLGYRGKHVAVQLKWLQCHRNPDALHSAFRHLHAGWLRTGIAANGHTLLLVLTEAGASALDEHRSHITANIDEKKYSRY